MTFSRVSLLFLVYCFPHISILESSWSIAFDYIFYNQLFRFYKNDDQAHTHQHQHIHNIHKHIHKPNKKTDGDFSSGCIEPVEQFEENLHIIEFLN